MAKARSLLDFIGYSPMGDDDSPAFREGEAAAHDLGVAYIGPWERRGDGFCEHVRRSARALASTGCPVHLRSAGKAIILGAPKELPADVKPLLIESIAESSFQIYQVILNASFAHTLTTHRFMTEGELEFVNKRKIIYSVWERDRIDEYTAKALNRVGQVWTACPANAAMLARCGVLESKVKVVPIPYFTGDPLLELRDPKRIRRAGVPRFYHIGKWEPRKAQDQIVEAFMMAFKPTDAQLILKCSTMTKAIDGFPQAPLVTIHQMLKHPTAIRNGWTADNWQDSIEVIRVHLLDKDMVTLHGFGDIYVSLSRGEGFDMPAFDAKLAGNLLLYTESGGPQFFADDCDFRVPASGGVPCHKMYGWEDSAEYIDFDQFDVMFQMRSAAAYVREGRRANLPHYMDRFHASIVGQEMLEYLREIGEPFRKEPTT